MLADFKTTNDIWHLIAMLALVFLILPMIAAGDFKRKKQEQPKRKPRRPRDPGPYRSMAEICAAKDKARADRLDRLTELVREERKISILPDWFPDGFVVSEADKIEINKRLGYRS